MSKRRIIGEVVLGAALAASPESAKGDWAQKVDQVAAQGERAGRIYTDVTDAGTRRKQVEEDAKNERARIAAEERARIARENTERQRIAGDVAMQTGKEGFSTDTTGGKTTFETQRPGTTPQERIEAGRNLSEEERQKNQQTHERAMKLLERQTDPRYKKMVPREKIE
ncbi:MAG: hypothetical protein NTX98_01415 [Candidatus Doudnabacteria bacterium]|nr:hypothetical protein [Candidatus Doudnabacteria bacterium]